MNTPDDSASAPCVDCNQRHAQIVSLRWEFRRHHLSEHERLVADWLLDLTLVKNRNRIRISRLADLGGVTGLDKSHVHRALTSLSEMRIVLLERKDALLEIAVNPAVTEWRCRFRISRSQISQALGLIEAVNGCDTPGFAPVISPVKEEDTTHFFKRAIAQLFSPTTVSDSAIGAETDTPLPPIEPGTVD